MLKKFYDIVPNVTQVFETFEYIRVGFANIALYINTKLTFMDGVFISNMLLSQMWHKNN